jgi:hypothetical protein
MFLCQSVIGWKCTLGGGCAFLQRPVLGQGCGCELLAVVGTSVPVLEEV